MFALSVLTPAGMQSGSRARASERESVRASERASVRACERAKRACERAKRASERKRAKASESESKRAKASEASVRSERASEAKRSEQEQLDIIINKLCFCYYFVYCNCRVTGFGYMWLGHMSSRANRSSRAQVPVVGSGSYSLANPLGPMDPRHGDRFCIISM